jgi:hypothetical protein
MILTEDCEIEVISKIAAFCYSNGYGRKSKSIMGMELSFCFK